MRFSFLQRAASTPRKTTKKAMISSLLSYTSNIRKEEKAAAMLERAKEREKEAVDREDRLMEKTPLEYDR